MIYDLCKCTGLHFFLQLLRQRHLVPERIIAVSIKSVRLVSILLRIRIFCSGGNVKTFSVEHKGCSASGGKNGLELNCTSGNQFPPCVWIKSAKYTCTSPDGQPLHVKVLDAQTFCGC